jgi:dipeptidyl-peptidase-2
LFPELLHKQGLQNCAALKLRRRSESPRSRHISFQTALQMLSLSVNVAALLVALLACCQRTAVAAEAEAPGEQPGALDLFPPQKMLFNVTIDHFRYSALSHGGEQKFPLRVFVYENFTYHAMDARPVFFYCGNEGAVEDFYNNSGFIFEFGRDLGAFVVFAEHRFYGRSLPFGNASFTPEALQLLSVEQALADYAEVIQSLPSFIGCKGTGRNAASGRCDVVLWGGSYGGMLAAWHRFKYPHLSVGAIASGAPVDFYPGTGVQADFEASFIDTFAKYGNDTSCGSSLIAGLAAADSHPSSQELLEAGLLPCDALSPNSAEQYSFYARGALASLAMLDYPYPCQFVSHLPANPVQAACSLLSNRSKLSSLASLHRAVLMYVNATGDLKCLDLNAELVGKRGFSALLRNKAVQSTDLGVVSWNYQACTQLIIEPITSDGYGFYPEQDSQIQEVEASCLKMFGVVARPQDLAVSFGRGADWMYASNIVFMENSKDVGFF